MHFCELITVMAALRLFVYDATGGHSSRLAVDRFTQGYVGPFNSQRPISILLASLQDVRVIKN